MSVIVPHVKKTTTVLTGDVDDILLETGEPGPFHVHALVFFSFFRGQKNGLRWRHHTLHTSIVCRTYVHTNRATFIPNTLGRRP